MRAKITTLLLAVFAVLATSCAPKVIGAHQIGDHEAATWVYIETDKPNENGVYRCSASEAGQPVCRKAKMD